MPLETGTYIADLVKTNPPTSDLETQGANHLQLIKTVLQNTFPNATRVVGAPTMVVKSAGYSIVVGDAQTTFLANTSGGSFTLTLPSLASGDAGWEISVCKTTTDTNPLFVIPPSGTMQSGEYAGLTKIRRCIPGRRSRIFWTGSSFIAERAVKDPIGTIHDYMVDTVPVGYEKANGVAFASAANYPEYFALFGTANYAILGRAKIGIDPGGGTVSGATTSNTSGGAQNHVLTQAELPAVGIASSSGFSGNTVTAQLHDTAGHNIDTITNSSLADGGGYGAFSAGSGTNLYRAATGSAGGGITITPAGSVSTSTTIGGSGTLGSSNAMSLMQPWIALQQIVVVE